MFRSIFSLFALLGLTSGMKLSPHKAPTYHVNNVQRRFTSDAPSHLINAMNRTMKLSFETDDLSFQLDLELNTKIFGEHTKIYAKNSYGIVEEQPLYYRAYLGSSEITYKNKDNLIEKGLCSLNFYKDSRFHCECSTDTDVFTVDLLHLQTRQSKDLEYAGPIKGTDTGHGMLLVKRSDVTGGKLLKDPTHSHHFNNARRKLLNDQSQLVQFTDCYDGQYQYVHGLYIGIITDTAFNSIYNNDNDDIASAVEAIFNSASGSNMIYYYQLNVMLTLGTFYIGESYTTNGYSYSPATYSSGYSINSRLDAINTWRKEFYEKNNNDNNGLWHLLTDHHSPPGTVGLAWVGSICSYNYGTGVSNYINPARSFYGTGTWETVAHEIGHNFGAKHPWEASGLAQGQTGGIMDYGDGLYPVGSGAYQFHPTYNKDEVCDAITNSFDSSNYRSSWRGLIPLANCWFQVSTDPTPQPTPAPVDPNQPTPEPTSPTPSPTPRPTTGSSTSGDDDDDDGVVIVDDDGNTYVWKWFDGYDGYSDCDLECVGDTDTAYKTKEYSCYKQTVTGTTTVGSTTTTYYSYSQVDDTNCDTGSKPTETVECDSSDVPSCSNECGDGIVGVDEACDTQATNGACCNSDCSGWYTDSVECFAVYTEIDAAFMDYSGAVYLFQDKYFAKYSSFRNYGSTAWTYNTPDSGYPKLISSSFPITSFTQDITAIAYASDSEVYVFQGMQFVKIDMSSGQYSGYPKTFNQEYNIVDDITNCGSITGAYKYPQADIISVACNNILSYGSAQYTISSVQSLTSYGSSYSGQVVMAMYNTPGTSSFVLFTTDSSTSRRRLSDGSGSILSGSNVTSFDQIEKQSCEDMNCKSCSSDDKGICYECIDNYILYGSVKCLTNDTLLYLNFDIDSSESIDHYFVENGYDTLTSYSYTKTGVTGENSTALLCDKTTKLPLQPLNFEDNSLVSSFRISFRIKPYSITYNQLISIDNKVSISLKINDATFNGSAEYIGVFTVGNNTYQSSVGTGIELNEWNVVEMQFSNDIFTVYTNGETVEQAYEADSDSNDENDSEWADTTVALSFNEWYIGENDNTGFDGEMDQVWFKVIDTTSTTYTSTLDDEDSTIVERVVKDKNYTMWLIIGISAITLSSILLCAVCYLSYKYYTTKSAANGAAPAGYQVMTDY